MPLDLIFAAGSGLLGISIALNAISSHGACTAIFVAVAAITVTLCASIRTLSRISWLAWVGLITLLVASKSPLTQPFMHTASNVSSVLMITIAVGVQDRPDSAPPGPWKSDYKLIGHPTFTKGISAVATFIFAYAGTPFFFPIVSEMREPRHYQKAMVLCQTVVTVTYVTIGIIVYYFCGSYVASPALGSAGKTIKQVSYGIALPGILVATTISTHVSCLLGTLKRHID